MLQRHFFILLLCCSCLQSTKIIDCKKSPQSECVNNSGICHLECLMNKQLKITKELLELFSESQHFDYNEATLDRLLDGDNSSPFKMSTDSTQSCTASAALNGTGVLVNPAAMARSTGPIKSCSDLPYTDQALLQLPDQAPPFWVFCVQKHKSTGSGWVVIQQRVFGEVSFFRSWKDYQEGFGILDNEFWLGLENIYRLTTVQHCELLVEMTDFKGYYKFARYSRFEIAGEDEEYAVRQLGSYSGTAGDSFRSHVGMKFSTFDHDNDHYDAWNCGLTYSSGWLFNKCFANGTNLNGLSAISENEHSIIWYGFSQKWQSLKYTRMMLRTII